MRPLNILIWHVHGNYLYYLTAKSPHHFYIPFKPPRAGDYVGKYGNLPFGDNVHDIPAAEVRNLDVDCVVFQRPSQYLEDQYELLSPSQRTLPRIYIEHDPPLTHPAHSDHVVDDPETLLVHVTPYNQLMWNSRRTPSCVIDHGVIVPEQIPYRGELARGLVVVNNITRRGRRLGLDVYEQLRGEIPLDLIGMGSEEAPGGLGEVLQHELPAFMSRYRFLFNPIRYTSLGLAVCEAMALGLPIVGLATTEMADTVENGVSGYVTTDMRKLAPFMKELLENEPLARRLSEGARRYARRRFSIDRFTVDWNDAFSRVTGVKLSPQVQVNARTGAGL